MKEKLDHWENLLLVYKNNNVMSHFPSPGQLLKGVLKEFIVFTAIHFRRVG